MFKRECEMNIRDKILMGILVLISGFISGVVSFGFFNTPRAIANNAVGRYKTISTKTLNILDKDGKHRLLFIYRWQ